ncbi:MAG: heme exporter protein CcmB, partial [Pseudomonadota bacterium]
MTARGGLAALIGRDLKLAYRQGGGGSVSLGFFVMTTALAPLSLGADAATLSGVAPGLIWIAAALAALLSTERIYQSDFEEGALDAFALGPTPLTLVAGAKAAAFWIANCAPVVAAAPIVGVLFNLALETTLWLTAALAAGSVAFAMIGSVAAALVVGVRRGGVLIAVLALPLFTPILIFGMGASD